MSAGRSINPNSVAVQGASAAADNDDDLDWRVKLAMLLAAIAEARAAGKTLILGSRPAGDCWMTAPANMADGIPAEVRGTLFTTPLPCSSPAC
jgi:hypothetical protein